MQWWSMAKRLYPSQIGGAALVGMRSVLECASQFRLQRLYRGPCQGLNPYLSAHGACSDCMLFFLSDPPRRLRWTFCFH